MREELVFYQATIEEWDYYYGLGIADPKHSLEPGPYSQVSTLDLRGTLVRPIGFACSLCTLTLSSRMGMMSGRTGESPTSIGMLSSKGDVLTAYVFIPLEQMAELVGVAVSGRFRSAVIVGSRLRYRSGTVHRFEVSTEVEELDEE